MVAILTLIQLFCVKLGSSFSSQISDTVGIHYW